MAFPEDVMTADEQIVLHLRPHWKVMIVPTLVVVLAAAAVVAALALGWAQAAVYVVVGLALIAAIWFAFWPWLVWRCTHYVFTNERIIFQTGVFSRDRRDIPLMRVNDHAMSQTFLERMLTCGTLTIESAGERGQTVLKDIPKVGVVQTKLYELVEADRDAHSYNDDERRSVATADKTQEQK